ncbi:MAG: lytic transglycosylase domain-containing protein [Marinovum algicola]|jgi:soluble lytic murein transglycosylase-like protein|uniref:Soluble lytic murein transglycosylase n=1 Tax=Marinovum algicola TaxID=42444 RepID=A0A975W6S0_9RHOB|nr:lytic transglycosylase domain-containing protein [Marinovum algicola]SEI52752.1 Soluble lytic murein transglycosylase [Marinovum algicola]SLN29790.1 Soluble lytic murein transglycosylase precursor [Marinovum algicola]
MRHLARGLVLCALMAAVGPARAEPPAFPDFEARRVKPPKPGAKKRILVQITAPVPRKPVAPAPDPAVRDDGDGAAYGWFWNRVSTRYEARNPGRLEEALAALDAAPAGQAVRAPRLSELQAIATAQGIEILKATVGTRVSPAFALAVMSVESGGRVDAVSSAGAQGLMQLMPATAARFGVSNASVAADNIRGGVKFLDFLVEKFEGDPILVLAGYNAGENSIGQHGGVPPFAETRDYIPKVLAAWKVAQGLCKTPPMFISDGCVFVTMN